MTGILGKTKADKLAGTVWGMDQVRTCARYGVC